MPVRTSDPLRLRLRKTLEQVEAGKLSLDTARDRIASIARSLPENSRNEFRIRAEQKLREMRERKVGQLVQARQEARQRFGTGPLASLATGVGSALRSSTFAQNFLEPAAATLTAPILQRTRGVDFAEARRLGEESLRQNIEAQGQVNPLATGIGNFAGNFFGPKGMTLRGLGGLGQKTAATGLSALSKAPGLSRLGLAPTAEMGGANLAQRVASQFVEGMGASTAAIAGNEAIETFNSDKTLHQAIDSTIEAVRSPTNIVLNLAVAGALGGFRSVPDEQLKQLMVRLRQKIPGLRVTPAELRSGSMTQALISTAGKLPIGRRIINRFLSENFYQPLRAATDRLKSQLFTESVPANRRLAAAGVRRLVGDAYRRGTVELERNRVRDRLFSEHGDDVVPNEEVSSLLRFVRDLGRKELKEKGSLEAMTPRGAQLDSVLVRLETMAKNALSQRRPNYRVTLRALDDVRDELDRVAKFAQTAKTAGIQTDLSGRSIREARQIRTAIRQIYRRMSPDIDRSVKQMSILSRIRDSLEPVAKATQGGMSDDVLNAFISEKHLIRRLSALRRRDPKSAERVAGHYLGKFIEKVTTSRELIKNDKTVMVGRMRALFHGEGPFRQSRFDAVLGPSTRRYFEDMAQITDRFSRGAGSALGSPTATRAGDAMVLGGAMYGPQLLLDFAQDSSRGWILADAAVNVLSLGLYHAAINSLINGRIGEGLNRLATGQVQLGPTRSAVALQQLSQPGSRTRRAAASGMERVGTLQPFSGGVSP